MRECMAHQFDPYEPLPDHLADTGPIRRVKEVSGWRRVVGLISLIGAAGLTIATALLILTSNTLTQTPNPVQPTTNANATSAPTLEAPTAQPQTNPAVQANGAPATLS